jgi:hypothetical protein
MSEDAAALFPGKTVTVMGEEVTVNPYSFKVALKQASKPARSIVRTLALQAVTSDTVPMVVVMNLMADSGDDMWKLIALSINKPETWGDGLSLDEGIELAAAVIAVNRDFFSQKMEGALAKLTKAIGEPSLPPSSEPATPGTPSSPTP